VLVDESETLQAIYFQSKEMMETFDGYPELLMVDATYKLNDLRMPLYVLMNVDGNGESEIVCFWVVATEDRHTMNALMDIFQKNNQKWDRIRAIMADKDMTERNVLATKLPQADILICLYHTLRTFRREITTDKMGISSGERNLCLEILQKMAYARNEEDYIRLYNQMKETVPTSVRLYFDANWHSIRKEWVEGLKDQVCHLMNSTNNRVESTNQKLKSVISRYSGITDFFKQLMTCVEVLKRERNHRAANLELKMPVGVAVDGPECQYRQLLTPYAYSFVRDQIKFSQDVTVIQNEGDSSVMIARRSGGVMVSSVISCACNFCTAMLLPCRHIFAARRHLGLPLFEKSLCAERWTLVYYKAMHRLFRSCPAETERHIDTQDLHLNEPQITAVGSNHSTVLSEQQKYRKCHAIAVTIAQIISEQGMQEFTYNMGVLESLRDLLNARKKVIIKVDSNDLGEYITGLGQRTSCLIRVIALLTNVNDLVT